MEEMIPRFLSARIPRANPCKAFPKYRNLEAIARTMWNIVVNGECESEVSRVREFTEYPIEKSLQCRGFISARGC